MERYSVGQAATLSYTAYDDEETALTITGPATYTIYDGAGTQVDTGAASAVAGSLTATLPVAKVSVLDTYKVRWTGKVSGTSREWWDYFELVGGYVFTLPELRASDPAYADTTKYPTAKLRKARMWVEERIEHPKISNVAFVPRAARETLRGDGTATLSLKWPKIRTVYSITVDDVAMVLTDVEINDRSLTYDAGWTQGAVIEVHYEHGYDECPLPVKEPAMKMAREILVSSALPNRAVSESTDVGVIRYSIAGRDGSTGFPEMDEVLRAFGCRIPMIG